MRLAVDRCRSRFGRLDAKLAKDLKEQLLKLSTAADDWSDDEKIELWNGLAAADGHRNAKRPQLISRK